MAKQSVSMVKELRGKTVEEYYYTGNYIILTFTDGTYTRFFGPVGLYTAAETADHVASHRDQITAKERAEYERLRAKFDPPAPTTK